MDCELNIRKSGKVFSVSACLGMWLGSLTCQLLCYRWHWFKYGLERCHWSHCSGWFMCCIGFEPPVAADSPFHGVQAQLQKGVLHWRQSIVFEKLACKSACITKGLRMQMAVVLLLLEVTRTTARSESWDWSCSWYLKVEVRAEVKDLSEESRPMGLYIGS